MNISQTNHASQQNPLSDSTLVSPELAESEAFLNQLTMAEQGPEWFTETDLKSEKERVNAQQQARRRESEDLEDDLIVSLTSQSYINNLKQADAMDSARIVSDSENRERLMQHVEKKHLHTPTVVEDGKVNRAENSFTKAMAGELEGTKNAVPKDIAPISAGSEMDDTGKTARVGQAKPAELLHADVMQRFDAALGRGMNLSATGKTTLQPAEKGVSEISKLNSADTTGKTQTKNTPAKITSLSGLSESSPENQKAATDLKAGKQNTRQATQVNIKDVVGNVKIMISSKTNEMVMKLAPEHLGKLEIKLKKEGDKLLGRFKVDSLEAKEAIEKQLPQLREGLAEQGIQIEEFTVFINGDDASKQSFAFDQGRDGDANHAGGSADAENLPGAGTGSVDSSAGMAEHSASGLNIYA